MKTLFSKAVTANVGLFLFASLAVNADTIVYNNSTSDTVQSLTFQNGYTIGNEILLGAPTLISSFDFEYYSPVNYFTGSVTMTVNLYQNTGSLVSGYPSPVSSLFTDTFALNPPTTALLAGGYGSTVIETPNITVPSDFTLAVTISGLSGTDSVGLELYNNVTVGNAYNDYWLNTGSGWQILTTPSSGPNLFGARFFTPVPEPSSICLGLVGGMFLIFSLRQRRLPQSSQD